MFHNVVAVVGLTLIAAIITAAIGLYRKEGWPDFRSWWDSEGVPIFIVLVLVLGIVCAERGCFHKL